MTVLVAGLLAGLAGAAAVLPERRWLTGRLGPDPSERAAAAPTVASAPDSGPAAGRLLAACALGALGAVLALGPLLGGLAAAACLLAGPALLSRLEPAARKAERVALVDTLPLALDLLEACLTAGASLAEAVGVVAAASTGPLALRLRAVAAALSLGTPPAEAWTMLSTGGPGDPLAPAARALSRSGEAGTPVAARLAALAVEARAAALAQRRQACRRAGVVAVAPLGLCFLPAFVLLGVVPLVAGLLRSLLAG